jgi:CelD/BcsL family acetyltransferase involved in cellulose biosynthesis
VIEIATITGEHAVADLRREWVELWRTDPVATPFQSPAWLLASWRHFGTPEPLVLTARAGGELVGLLPLYLLREPGCRKLLPIGVGLSDYVGALLDPAAPAVAEKFVEAIAATPGWDECWLPDLAADGALAMATLPTALDATVVEASPCPVLPLPRTPAGLAAVVPRKTLRDLHQARSRAAAAGGVAIETIGEERLDEALDDLFRLHEQRWRARGEPGVCDGARVQSFHRAAAHGLLAAGMLRLYRLRIGGAVLAVYYGFIAKETAFAYLGGFDPSQPRLSPGMLILAHAIEQAVAEGAQRFDFLRGGEVYKYAWGARDRAKTSLHLRRR